MARGNLLINLARAGIRGEREHAQKIVEAIAAEERAKNHHLLADRLLEQTHHRPANACGAPASFVTGNGASAGLLVEKTPTRPLRDLTLPPAVNEVVDELVEEHARADLLRAYNLEPRHRILLTGPPGNGKTSLAEGIAHALGLTLLTVSYDRVVGSYLGETARRIARVFEFARSRHCVLFFDEFDAVGKERGDRHETGEIKRVVSTLLMQIDALPSYVVIITASNHPELLDRAAWRRFQVRLELPPPNKTRIEEWYRNFQRRTGRDFGLPARAFADKTAGMNFAELEDFGLDALRQIVLHEPCADASKIVTRRLAQWKKRGKSSAGQSNG